MKNPHTRWFYTALGCRVAGVEAPPPPRGVPFPMLTALSDALPALPPGRVHPGAELSGNRCRRIYTEAWNVLRTRGFRRPGRFQPWPGVELLIPFVHGPVGVIPQGFSPRVPHGLRGFALAGKSCAALRVGMRLVAVCARVSPEGWQAALSGGVVLCTPETLPQALSELDFPTGRE